MPIKILNKKPYRKIVRQIPNSKFSHRVKPLEDEKPQAIEENKEVKIDKDMADDRLEKIEQIMGTKAPKRVIKREKKDKGLIERTENSAILLTEDNKMVLTD